MFVHIDLHWPCPWLEYLSFSATLPAAMRKNHNFKQPIKNKQVMLLHIRICEGDGWKSYQVKASFPRRNIFPFKERGTLLSTVSWRSIYWYFVWILNFSSTFLFEFLWICLQYRIVLETLEPPWIYSVMLHSHTVDCMNAKRCCRLLGEKEK